jgi:hypothetical protein
MADLTVRRMPVLSTFLGHTSPEATYWYLQASPQLLALAAQRLDADHGAPPPPAGHPAETGLRAP